MKHCYKNIIPIIFILALVGCASMGKIASDMVAQEKACKERGGAFMLDKGCIMPDEKPVKPIEPDKPVDPIKPEPTPSPDPVKPEPTGSYLFNEGEYFQFPEIKGRKQNFDITFSLKGINGNAFPDRDGWFFAAMGKAKDGLAPRNLVEYNLQFHIFRDGKSAQIRLISQKFDKSCGGSHCERGDGIVNMTFDPSVKYDVRIYGPVPHTDKGYPVWRMNITTGGNHVGTWEIQYLSEFESIDWIRVGNGGIFPDRPGQSEPLTVINPVIKDCVECIK